jgi:hypothetical protein
MEVLDPIPLTLNADALGQALQVERTGAWDQFRSAFEVAVESISPKAAYTIQYVDERTEDGVVIDGVHFRSRVLRKNLERVERVFPYVTTIGPSLEQWLTSMNDLLQKVYLDAIGNMALMEARQWLSETLHDRYAIDGLSFMSPGSLKDWPIEEQKPLFSFLDDAARAVNVTLTEACLMMPNKSVSGIYFPAKTTFYNCQLCPRDGCMGRKAPYSPELARAYGIPKEREDA